MKRSLSAGVGLLVFLLLAGIGIVLGPKVLDKTLAMAILAVYIASPAILLLKALFSRHPDRKQLFSCGELALLPCSWRRWMLADAYDQRRPPVNR